MNTNSFEQIACIATPNKLDSEFTVTEEAFFAMGTLMFFNVQGFASQTVLQKAKNLTLELEQLLSLHLPLSDLVRLNSARQETKVAELTSNLLRDALVLAQRTNGYFNPLLGQVNDLWKAGKKHKVLPNPLAIQKALHSSLLSNLELDAPQRAKLLQDAQIDLGGIGKGYAADLAISLLKKQTCSGLLSFGTSSVAILGQKADKQKWRIGLKIPTLHEEAYYGILELEDCFLSTSGAYEQNFTIDGHTYHHLLNPQTGYPADNQLQAVTIICESGIKSEAFSTALFTMGLEKALNFYHKQRDFEAIFILKDRLLLITPGLQQKLSFTGEQQGYSLSIL